MGWLLFKSDQIWVQVLLHISDGIDKANVDRYLWHLSDITFIFHIIQLIWQFLEVVKTSNIMSYGHFSHKFACS